MKIRSIKIRFGLIVEIPRKKIRFGLQKGDSVKMIISSTKMRFSKILPSTTKKIWLQKVEIPSTKMSPGACRRMWVGRSRGTPLPAGRSGQRGQPPVSAAAGMSQVIF